MAEIKKPRYNTLSFLQEKQLKEILKRRLLLHELWKLGISMNWKSQLIP